MVGAARSVGARGAAELSHHDDRCSLPVVRHLIAEGGNAIGQSCEEAIQRAAGDSLV